MDLANSASDGLCRFSSDNGEWIWDVRAGLLCLRTHSSTVHQFEFPLGSFSQIEPKLEKMSSQETLKLVDALTRLTQTRPNLSRQSTDQRSIRYALGTLAFRLLCFSLQRCMRNNGARRFLYRLSTRKAQDFTSIQKLQASAEAVLRWLGADSSATAWRSRYLEDLGYDRRYQLIELGRRVLEENSVHLEALEGTQIRLSESAVWEALWWTTRCQYELASEWYQQEGHSNPAARHALLDSSALYLHLLKEEPRRQALEEFLNSFGSDREREVMRVFSLRSQLRKEAVIARDEAAYRTFGGWLLNRYSLLRAGRLVWLAGIPRRESICASLALILIVAGAVLFFGWWVPPPLRNHQLLLQIGFQFLGLVVVVMWAPSWFRLLLPRALFGSLLAWLTIIFLQVLSTFPPAVRAYDFGPPAEQSRAHKEVGEDAELREACHLWLKGSMWRGSKLIVVLASALVCFMFIVNEVRGRIPHGGFWRSVLSLFIMLLGALFWAAMFAHPIRWLIEGPLHPGHCNCTYSIWLIGGVLSALFGLLVQLLWDDRSIADPLGESS